MDKIFPSYKLVSGFPTPQLIDGASGSIPLLTDSRRHLLPDKPTYHPSLTDIQHHITPLTLTLISFANTNTDTDWGGFFLGTAPRHKNTRPSSKVGVKRFVRVLTAF